MKRYEESIRNTNASKVTEKKTRTILFSLTPHEQTFDEIFLSFGELVAVLGHRVTTANKKALTQSCVKPSLKVQHNARIDKCESALVSGPALCVCSAWVGVDLWVGF